MSIKGTSKEWFVGKEKSNIYNFWYNKTSFHYNELDSITYYYPNGSKPGNVSFNKRSHEVINFKFKEKASDPVYRAMELIRENNPNLKVEEIGIKSESGTPDLNAETNNNIPTQMQIIGKTKICKFCRMPIAHNARVCPYCARKQGINKIVVSCVALILILAVYSASGDNKDSGGKERPNQKENPVSNTGQTEQYVEDLNNEETTVEEETNTFYVGDVFDSDKVQIMYIDSGNYTSDNQFLQPSEGNKYIFLEFSITNTGDSDISVGAYDFDCYADDIAVDQLYVSGGDDELTTITTLSTGKIAKGKVYYEIPTDSQKIEIEYETSFWTQDKIYFIFE